MADLQCLSHVREAVYMAGKGRASRAAKERTMIVSTMDIVMAAIGALSIAGLGISISAWRHAARVERELDKDQHDGIPSAI
ncbi:hypothetical protein amb0668 [Paramagnetospirillum magneticum AMB-1]|uniref:Uncharacterized protein n=2 Tax=Paramagnetospirillum magneticum TaxID=84159 RepID=Q2W9K3_PARM1|nr:hypothetical protein amb0668 [Paramagnetospirillum magneticum AMB-1]